LTAAIFELLAEKNDLTGEEIVALDKKLRDESPLNPAAYRD
jgi:hypothetical protein